MDGKQRMAEPYSVVNGKLFSEGATARIEVTGSEARDRLNSLLQQRDELAAALRNLVAFFDTTVDPADHPSYSLEAARAALARIDTQVKP